MENTNSGPSHKILKRRPIHTSEDTKSLPYSSVVPEPEINTLINNGTTENGQEVPQFSKDLYVYGRAPDNGRFRFGRILGEVGSSIKKLLGFRN